MYVIKYEGIWLCWLYVPEVNAVIYGWLCLISLIKLGCREHHLSFNFCQISMKFGMKMGHGTLLTWKIFRSGYLGNCCHGNEKTCVFAWKSTCLAIAAISSDISQPISTKFDMVNWLGSESVVVESEFRNVKSVAMGIWNADFEASFDREDVR